ncbi:MAG: YccF domain-containing protein [Lachnospiraceae bacterium]|nr:YccF domain-containing protein [Lachnospiraceae bacterium]
MKTLGNILWFIFGGLFSGLSWWIAGVLWCITIIGIPYGLQCFKFASLSFWPFGKEVVYGGGVGMTLVNIIWLVLFGIWMAIENALIGLIWCITIVGIPFGMQFFKIAKLSLMPFGAEVIKL